MILITWVVFQLGFAARRRSSTAARAGDRDWPRVRRRSPRVRRRAGARRSSPRAATAPGATLDVAAVQGGGEQGTRALDVPSTRGHRAPPRGDRGRSSPTPSLDLVLWPENVVDTDDFATSERARGDRRRGGAPRRAVRRRRHRGRARPAGPDHQRPGRRHARRRGDEPLRQGAPRAVRRVRAAARACSRRSARRSTRCRRTPSPAPSPAVLDLPDGTRARPSSSRGRCSSAAGPARASSTAARSLLNPTNGASYTGTIVQTQQVASSRLRAIETGRWVVQAAPTGFSRVRHARRRRHRPHGRQRAGGDPPRRRAARRAHVVRRRSATGRGSLAARRWRSLVVVARVAAPLADGSPPAASPSRAVSGR